MKGMNTAERRSTNAAMQQIKYQILSGDMFTYVLLSRLATELGFEDTWQDDDGDGQENSGYHPDDIEHAVMMTGVLFAVLTHVRFFFLHRLAENGRYNQSPHSSAPRFVDSSSATSLAVELCEAFE